MKRSLVESMPVVETYAQIEGVRVGKIARVEKHAQVFVDFPGNSDGPVVARLTNSAKLHLPAQSAAANQEVLLAFEDNDPQRPIILDVLYSLVEDITASSPVTLEMEKPKDVLVDGKKVTFDAKEQIVLRCGEASITLTRAGKVLIRGAYLLNRSSGVNRIKGASVQIN